jgi:Zn ribbon nucleic-acid-binding protein
MSQAAIPSTQRKKMGRLPRPKKIPLSQQVVVEPGKLTERPILNDDGSASDLTLPIEDMSYESYRHEMAQRGKIQMFNKLLATMPVEDLKFALANHNTQKAMNFLGALIDPRNIKRDIAELAVESRIGLGELMQIWRNDKLTVTLNEIFQAAPLVAKDVAKDAQTIDACCPRCDGAGEIQVARRKGQAWIECVNCKGKGTIRQVGDARSREHMLKATGVLKSDQAMSVVINNNRAASGPESVIEELEQLSGKSRQRGVVDVDLD